MAVSIAQYVDLLFKKLQGVAKTANSTVKSASNESIASPAFLRGDIVWMQSADIPSTAQAVPNIANARINGNSVECVADTTVPPISGIYPTWLSNVSYWIPQELGATWLPKVFVGPSGAANIQSTGTQIFAAGIGGVGEYYFDTQAGVLNFIGETIPSVLTAGNVVYISGYEYVGAIGVTNQPGNLTVGNLSITSTTANSVLYTNTDNFVVTSNNLTFDGSSLVLTGIANVSANLSAGNVYSGGVIDAVGNISGGNLITVGLITATGNVTGGNLTTTGTANVATLEVTGTANVALTATVGNLNTSGVVSATGNVTGGNLITAGLVSAVGNVNGGNVNTVGNVTANYVIAESGLIGNVTINDLNVGNITANGFANITGNVTGGNLITSGLITVVGNIIGSGAVFSGNVTSDTFIGNIIGNSGTVGNLTFSNTTISTQLANGNITLAATGNSFVQIGGTYGFVVPVGNTAQRLETGNLAGTVRFNTDVSRIEVYDGTEWDQIVSGVTSQTLNGDGSTVAFVLDRASTSAAALIMLNGVVQRPGFAYDITPSPGTNLVFTEAPAIGDVIDIRYL
jgi:hypothetical protein